MNNHFKRLLINDAIMIVICIAGLFGTFKYSKINTSSIPTITEYIPDIEYSEPAKMKIIADENVVSISMAYFSEEFIDDYISECLDTLFPDMYMNRQHENIIEFKAYDLKHYYVIELVGDKDKRTLTGTIERVD